MAQGQEVMDMVEKYVPSVEPDENTEVIRVIGEPAVEPDEDTEVIGVIGEAVVEQDENTGVIRVRGENTRQSRPAARSVPRPLRERNRSPELSSPEREEDQLLPEIHPEQLDHLYAISDERKKKEQERKCGKCKRSFDYPYRARKHELGCTNGAR